MRSIVLIVHNVRSCHNVGSLLRTAEGLGVEKVYLTGYTPYPVEKKDSRLPHVAQKTHGQIAKTALGAENLVEWQHELDVDSTITKLKQDGYEVCALEQSGESTPLNEYKPSPKVAIIVGNEVAGLDSSLLALSSKLLFIPMFGKKESFNVAQAAAMALYHITFHA